LRGYNPEVGCAKSKTQSGRFGDHVLVDDPIALDAHGPPDRLAFALRVPPNCDALLETTGRRTGKPRVTPVCDCLAGDTFWIIAQCGHSADYGRAVLLHVLASARYFALMPVVPWRWTRRRRCRSDARE
jgi:hypothetical protein